MAAYYNEHDPGAAAWLRELIKEGLIADGIVDTRSIVDVRGSDLRDFVQCHFFAGIGGWSYALRLAGWPDDRPVWTGSCPCQPFSSAGAQAGGNDPRDLWPRWFELLRECAPRVVFGEQVEAAIRHGWLDRVCTDLESEGYAVGAVGLPSAGVGAFDIRQRLWFVADAERGDQRGYGRESRGESGADGRNARATDGDAARSASAVGLVADADTTGLPERIRDRRLQRETVGTYARQAAELGGNARELADADGGQPCDGGIQRGGRHDERPENAAVSFWSDCDWIPCRDGKARPVEPGTFPLAHGVPARVGRLRGYGNAINPWVAAAVIAAYLDLRA